MKQICRYYDPRTKTARLGGVIGGMVHDLSGLGIPTLESLSAFLRDSDSAAALEQASGLLAGSEGLPLAELDIAPTHERPHLLTPLDQQEVWAAGVTYLRSKSARMEEAKGSGNFYDRVYDAVRPEIFFKSTPNRTSGPKAPVRIRQDSSWNVPEPELALVLGADLRLVGFSAGNDMSSRDIEGENPLYLPQAKIYSQSCALGPVVTLAGADFKGDSLEVELVIERGGQEAFKESTSTSRIKRSFAELIEYLGRENQFPHGAMMLTGTGIVPPDDFTLEPGDVVHISIEGIGRLTNPVVRG